MLTSARPPSRKLAATPVIHAGSAGVGQYRGAAPCCLGGLTVVPTSGGKRRHQSLDDAQRMALEKVDDHLVVLGVLHQVVVSAGHQR